MQFVDHVLCFQNYDPNLIVDFHSTIFVQDTGRILFDAHRCGPQRCGVLEAQINNGERLFREVSEEMWDPLMYHLKTDSKLWRRLLKSTQTSKSSTNFALQIRSSLMSYLLA